jgi:Ca-activated chloride channel family protein
VFGGGHRWERGAQALRVVPQARAALRRLLPFVEEEAAALGDPTLRQEVELLQKLVAV